LKHVIQAKSVIFQVIFEKVKARWFQIYSLYWKVDYQHCRTVWRLFLFENSWCCFPKSFLVTDIAEFSTEAKHMHYVHVWTKDVSEIL